VCTQCRSGFWLIDGCCTECYDGFFKTTTNGVDICIRCTDVNCKVCGSNAVCSECKPSYYLMSDNSCYPCTAAGYAKTVTNNIATCSKCIVGCNQCILNQLDTTWTCAECANSKFVEFCSKTYCIDCDDSTTQIQIEKYCYESNDCTTNCKLCASATACATCFEAYYLSASKQCLPCGSNCILCTSNIGTCSKCIPNYYLYGGVCRNDCPTTGGYVVSTGTIFFFPIIFLKFSFYKKKKKNNSRSGWNWSV
jgi:hypothetical protein